MTTGLIPYVFSFVWPTAFLLLAFSFVPRRHRVPARPAAGFAAMLAIALAVSLIPVGGIPLGRWLTGVCSNFSLPLLALLTGGIGRRIFRTNWLGARGTRAALWFGAAAGGLLYPMAMGLGGMDSYAAGWNFSWLFAGTGALAMLLIWRGNKFGLVLLSAIAAYHLGLLESDNYWDYLVDPVYFLVSLGALVRQGLRGFRRRTGRVPGQGPVTTPAAGSR
jgi:hypothetical protein